MREHVPERLRDRAVRRLRRGYARGVLGTDTLEQRVAAVLSADSCAGIRHAARGVASPGLIERASSWLFPRDRFADTSGLLDALACDRPAVIGRSPACDLVLRNDSVSRRHVMVTVGDDRILITDLGSTNGTLLNGRWMSQAEAHAGDVLRLGEIELRL